jgi:hypothetical protein
VTIPSNNAIYRASKISSLLFIPQLPKEYAVLPLILFGLAIAEIFNLVTYLIWQSSKVRSKLFLMIALGTLFLSTNTVFYGRFLASQLVEAQSSAFDSMLDVFMISFTSGLMLMMVHAIDVQVVLVFQDVHYLTSHRLSCLL